MKESNRLSLLILSITPKFQRTDNQSFGIDFKKENGDRVAFIGTSSSEVDKATFRGASGLKLQTTNSEIKMISGSGYFQWEVLETEIKILIIQL